MDELLRDIDSDTSNEVLTLARICVGTDEVRPKNAAADWALHRLPAKHRPVLLRARAIYLGEEEEHWDDLQVERKPTPALSRQRYTAWPEMSAW